MSPRLIFEQELERLKNEVTGMGERAEISYDRLVLAIKGDDRKTLEQLLDNDRQMTDMQRSIEARCLTLLTRQQPVARDMRIVSAALKVVTDIERVGDHVSDIAELYLRMETGKIGADNAKAGIIGEDNAKAGIAGADNAEAGIAGADNAKAGTAGSLAENPEDAGATTDSLLTQMMEEAREMLHQAVEAFVNGEISCAEKVIARDDVVDALFNQVKNHLMKAIQAQTLDGDRVVDYLMIAKYLEKIADHAVNIGEWAIFRVTGDMQGVKLY